MSHVKTNSNNASTNPMTVIQRLKYHLIQQTFYFLPLLKVAHLEHVF